MSHLRNIVYLEFQQVFEPRTYSEKYTYQHTENGEINLISKINNQ